MSSHRRWLRSGLQIRQEVRNWEGRGSYSKPSLSYVSLQYCRPNKYTGRGAAEWGVSMKLLEPPGSHRYQSLYEGSSQGHLRSHLAKPKLQRSFLIPWRNGLGSVLMMFHQSPKSINSWKVWQLQKLRIQKMPILTLDNYFYSTAPPSWAWNSVRWQIWPRVNILVSFWFK